MPGDTFRSHGMRLRLIRVPFLGRSTWEILLRAGRSMSSANSSSTGLDRTPPAGGRSIRKGPGSMRSVRWSLHRGGEVLDHEDCRAFCLVFWDAPNIPKLCRSIYAGATAAAHATHLPKVRLQSFDIDRSSHVKYPKSVKLPYHERVVWCWCSSCVQGTTRFFCLRTSRTLW